MNIELDGLYLLLGTPGSGKTHLMNYLMYQNKDKFSYGIVFSNTEFDIPFPFVPKKYIFPEYEEKALENLLEIQRKRVEKKQKVKHAFIIFDDSLDGPQFNSIVLKKAILQLRHYYITVFMSSQYTNLIPGRFRSTAYGIFIFHNDTKINLNAMFESFGQRFDSYNDFKNFILANLEKHHSFIYYNKQLISDERLKKLTDDEKIQFLFKVMMCPAKIPEFRIKF